MVPFIDSFSRLFGRPASIHHPRTIPCSWRSSPLTTFTCSIKRWRTVKKSRQSSKTCKHLLWLHSVVLFVLLLLLLLFTITRTKNPSVCDRLNRMIVGHARLRCGKEKKKLIAVDQFVEFLNRHQRDPRLNEILYPYANPERARDIFLQYEPSKANVQKGSWFFFMQHQTPRPRKLEDVPHRRTNREGAGVFCLFFFWNFTDVLDIGFDIGQVWWAPTDSCASFWARTTRSCRRTNSISVTKWSSPCVTTSSTRRTTPI